MPPEKSFFEVESADARQGDLDRFHLLEPALSFLEPGEQASLAERFGFDGLKWGRISAIFLLIAVGPFAVGALLGFLLVAAGVRPSFPRVLGRPLDRAGPAAPQGGGTESRSVDLGVLSGPPRGASSTGHRLNDFQVRFLRRLEA